MKNAVFDKSMENVRNHVDEKIINKVGRMVRRKDNNRKKRISTAVASLRKI